MVAIKLYIGVWLNRRTDTGIWVCLSEAEAAAAGAAIAREWIVQWGREKDLPKELVAMTDQELIDFHNEEHESDNFYIIERDLTLSVAEFDPLA